MATTIRMQRGGRTHAPYYRMVVTNSRNRNRGPIIDQVGVYHPCGRPEPTVELDVEKTLAWLAKGVTLSPTARNVLTKQGVLAKFNASQSGQTVAAEAPAAAEPVAAPTEA